MNVFVLSEDPEEAAQYQCDKHVVKMCLETAQILSSAVRFYDAALDLQYKSTHVNHPCCVWARETQSNFLWLYKHGIALCHEYQFRYGKVHKSLAVIQDCYRLRSVIPFGKQTDFPLCMPDEYKCDDAVQSYRNYYRGDKARFAKWRGGKFLPDWWCHQPHYDAEGMELERKAGNARAEWLKSQPE
jgi:hypothetical protein